MAPAPGADMRSKSVNLSNAVNCAWHGADVYWGLLSPVLLLSLIIMIIRDRPGLNSEDKTLGTEEAVTAHLPVTLVP